MQEAREPPFVGVVTYNPLASLRLELLECTVRSIEKAFPTCELFLQDNGSTDGSFNVVSEILGNYSEVLKCAESCKQFGRWHFRQAQRNLLDKNFTPGAGRYRLWCHMFGHVYANEAQNRSPFWVWSDDDMVWAQGAEAKLRHFWEVNRKGSNILILSGLLEPEYHWNTPHYAVEIGGVRVLVRDSAPGCAWTFEGPRTLGLPNYGKNLCFGYDYKGCMEIKETGFEVAQIDLAEHIGWEASTHENAADKHKDARPLDREKWGV